MNISYITYFICSIIVLYSVQSKQAKILDTHASDHERIPWSFKALLLHL